jgi:hypothetical protein
MVKGYLITVLIGQPKVNDIYNVGVPVEPDENIFGLHVKMNEMAIMNKLDARNLQTKSVQVRHKPVDAYQLISKLKNSFKAKFAIAGVEEIL